MKKNDKISLSFSFDFAAIVQLSIFFILLSGLSDLRCIYCKCNGWLCDAIPMGEILRNGKKEIYYCEIWPQT